MQYGESTDAADRVRMAFESRRPAYSVVFVLCIGKASVRPDTWVRYPDAYKKHGHAQDGVRDIPECKALCVNDTKCSSIDWVHEAPDGQHCRHHGPTFKDVPVDTIQPQKGVTHYELRRSRSGYWVEMPNSEVEDPAAKATAAGDAESCRTSCADDPDCAMVNWNPAASGGKRCLIHGASSRSLPVRVSAGVTLYQLHRGGDGHCGEMHIISMSLSCH